MYDHKAAYENIQLSSITLYENPAATGYLLMKNQMNSGMIIIYYQSYLDCYIALSNHPVHLDLS